MNLWIVIITFAVPALAASKTFRGSMADLKGVQFEIASKLSLTPALVYMCIQISEGSEMGCDGDIMESQEIV